VVQLLENKVPLEDLTMSKKLTRKPEDYKNPAPHSELAKRLQATQPAHIAPKTGDRIDFVIRPGYKGEKTCMRAVTPDDVRNGEASADTRWYLSNQLEAPLRRIFEIIMDNASSIFEVSSVQQSATISNPMMRSFVQRSEGHKKRTHSGASVEYKKKKKHKQARSITSFFN
jgi:DNA polymerase elongation subunit (family B)